MSDDTATEELTGSIFDDDIDVDDIPDNPNHLPEDTYICRVAKAVLKPTANKDKIGLTISYQIIEGPYRTMFPFTEWLHVPRKSEIETEEDKVKAARNNAKLKQRYIAFGIPADEFKSTTPQDLLNREVMVKTQNKKQDGQERINVRSVEAVSEEIRGSDEGMDVFAKESNSNAHDF